MVHIRHMVNGLLCLIDGENFFAQLENCSKVAFPQVSLKNSERVNVCGEVLQLSDLQTLKGSSWLNDKVCNPPLLNRFKMMCPHCKIFRCVSQAAVLLEVSRKIFLRNTFTKSV